MPQWVVHKFGGTSVAGAERYRGVAEIMRREPGARKGIVVSAMSKVTDGLIRTVEAARQRVETPGEDYGALLEALKQKHLATLKELLPQGGPRAEALQKAIESDCRDLLEVLRGV